MEHVNLTEEEQKVVTSLEENPSREIKKINSSYYVTQGLSKLFKLSSNLIRKMEKDNLIVRSHATLYNYKLSNTTK